MNKIIKIAIFCREFECLADWEYRLFNDIINNKSIVIRKIYQKKNIYKKLSFNDFIFKIFVRLENLHTNLPFLDNKTKKRVISFLKKIPLKKIDVKSNKYFDYFNNSISDEIKSEKFDLILRHDFNIIKGKVLNASKYGIWSFHHGDTSNYKGGPSGFWEIVNNESVTGVTLIKLNDYLDKGDIIQKSFYSTKKNFLINNYFIMDKSFKILTKSIEALINNNKINFIKQKSISKKIYRSPNLFYILKYYRIFLNHKLFKIINLCFKIFNINNNVWSIFYSHNNIDIHKNTDLLDKKNEFWADPCYFKYKNLSHILFERYNLNQKKGIISIGNLKNNKLIGIKDIVKRDYHLSYPQVFQYKGKTMMTFESWQANKCEILSLEKFPYKWKKYCDFFNGINAADPTFYRDRNNNLWLFVNISKDLINDHDSELYIYLVKNDFKKFISHKKNPVITDSRIARGAGSIFIYKNKIIRPSQINIYDTYGYGLNFQIIKKLSLNDYEEVNYKKFFYDQKSKYNGIHHVTKTNKGFIFDRRYKYY